MTLISLNDKPFGLAMTNRELIERGVLAILNAWLMWRITLSVLNGEESYLSLFVLVGELLVLIFVVLGRPAQASSGSWRDWFIAFGATSAPLLVMVGGEPVAPKILIAAIAITALSVQIAAKLNLNRSFGILPANRGIVTTGFYSIVRHPVYASYLLGHIGFLLLNPSFWNCGAYGIALGLQILRIREEEKLLVQDPAYAEYCKTVRYRLLPGVF